MPSKAPTALIVDDDFTLRYVLARLARLAGYEIVEANDGASAFEAASDNAPDLMVADVRRPTSTVLNSADGSSATNSQKASLC